MFQRRPFSKGPSALPTNPCLSVLTHEVNGRSVGSRIFLASSSSAYLSIHLSYCPSAPRPPVRLIRGHAAETNGSKAQPPSDIDRFPSSSSDLSCVCMPPLLACLIRQENMAELLACHTSPPPRLDGLRNPRLCGLLRRRVRSGWGREIDRRIGWDGRRGE